MSLTKTDILRRVADAAGISKTQAAAALDEVVAAAVESIRRDGDFVLPGVVKIAVATRARRAARDGVNPATGEKIRIAAQPVRRVLKARVAKPFAEEALTKGRKR